MKTALLIIDIQNDYFPAGRMELSGSEVAASCSARLLNAFRQAQWPVFHVQHLSNRPGAGFFLPGTIGAEIHPSVAPLPGEPVIVKHFPNSFRETDLLARLREEHIGSLLLCGMMTHMCVDATVRAAFDLGFSCTVAHDACATMGLTFNGLHIPPEHVHGSIMAALGAVYAQLKETDAILDTIGSSA
ncbi:MAG: cysteine hydrolase [Desulfuromonadales bacterium]|nr:cysteine hydrolase [Desulfuromonadales bacterium]